MPEEFDGDLTGVRISHAMVVNVDVDVDAFVETVRHLVFAMDKWFTAPILGEGFHPAGVPNSGSVDYPWPGLDDHLTPTVDEALSVRAQRGARFGDYLAAISAADLDRSIDVLEHGTHSVREGIYTVLEEEFWHNRYARRDLDTLLSATR
jgi:hypothetical protein